MKRNRENILKVLAQATPEEHAIGLEWYRSAREQAASVAAEYGVSVATAAAVIAALSPNQSWATNLSATRKLCYAWRNRLPLESIRIPAYTDGKKKALRVLNGESPESVLRGNKVLSFYGNIAFPDAPGSVTVDAHAYSIWKGKRFRVGEKIKELKRIGVYGAIAADYATVARSQGLLPHQLQAITWLVWRRLHVSEWRVA